MAGSEGGHAEGAVPEDRRHEARHAHRGPLRGLPGGARNLPAIRPEARLVLQCSAWGRPTTYKYVLIYH